jgi:hypothetical protein
MKLNYSEFSFGYAFTENLIRSSASSPNTAPVFPNLVQEALLGYDVKVDLPGLPIFFQFKLPELMVRETAREISEMNLNGLSVPFFRMPLMRRDKSDQHAHLIQLENSFPHTVFYASPRLKSIAEFNSAYIGAKVHLQSALFSPNDIGPLPDDQSHFVSYTKSSSIAWRCSEPKKVKAQNFETFMNSASQMLEERSRRSLEDVTRETRESILHLLPPQLRAVEGEVRQRAVLRSVFVDRTTPSDARARAVSVELVVLKELVRVGLGVDFLVAQPREPK